MLRRRIRRGWGRLALLVALYGLALAPVLHAVYGHGGGLLSAHGEPPHGHVEGDAPQGMAPAPRAAPPAHAHAPDDEEEPHAPAQPHSHASFSVEHLQAVAIAAHELEPPRVAWVEVRTEPPGRPRPRAGAALRPTAMPQGP